MSQVDNVVVHQLTKCIGAEVLGVTLSSRQLDRTTSDRLYELLMEHQVLFFRDLELKPEDQVSFARSFGNIAPPHPIYGHVPESPEVTVLDFGPGNPPDTDVWHTDLTFRNSPPFASVLYSRRVPLFGGDTLWASMTAAHDALPDGIKSDISEMRAIHDMSDFRNNYTIGEPNGRAEKLSRAHAEIGSAVHPLVIRHPRTGRKFLNCNPGFTIQVEGMTSSDSRRLLEYLYGHMTKPEFQVRFKWTKGTLAMWDNRCTMHYALGDYLPFRRVMHRVTVVNDRRCGSWTD